MILSKVLSSRPLLSRSGCISLKTLLSQLMFLFSSPFIEERLYLKQWENIFLRVSSVLVPFYRGAVVFDIKGRVRAEVAKVLVPFYRGAVVFLCMGSNLNDKMRRFSSPFIEERLYLLVAIFGSYHVLKFSSPFIEERLYL